MTVGLTPANQELAAKLVELLESAHKDAKHALDLLKSGDIDLFARIMADVQNVVLTVRENLRMCSDKLSISQCFNIIENINHSIGNMADRIMNSDKRRGEIILEFEMIPLLAELKEDLYFFALIYPDKQRMDKYYKEEFALNHQNEYIRDGKAHYDVSIAVTAWNKIEYTRQCIESLFQFTNFEGLNCELITINHGSQDGTGEYFESLPHEKKINFKKNMCTIAGSYLHRVVEGKFCVNVSNDVVLTKNWLENLLACIRSDDKIAITCPVTPNTSNLQAIEVLYKNIEEMQEYAAGYNISNPSLWEERVRLCPPIAMLNVDILNKTGFWDRYFVNMEFTDDDIGAQFRKKGYKQIFQLDTFCHHFGSITLGEAQRGNGTLEKSRKLFKDKYGIDPWGLGFCYDINIISSLDLSLTGQVSILGIDAGIGSTPLQIKNELRRRGNNTAVLFNFTQDIQFEPDLEPYSDCFNFDSIENIGRIYKEEQFDYIYIGKKLEEYAEFESLLLALKKILKKNGQLIFQITNPFHVLSLYELHGLKMPHHAKRMSRIDPDWLLSHLSNMFSRCDIIAIRDEIPARLVDFYNYLLKSNKNNKNSELILQTSVFQFKLRG